jgi:uncharacterized membrane protein YbhN (UPF0104 family)
MGPSFPAAWRCGDNPAVVVAGSTTVSWVYRVLAMRDFLCHVFRPYLEPTWVQLGLLLVGAGLLQLAGGAGSAYLAGFSALDRASRSFDWPNLVGLVGALGLSFVGYYFAYRGVSRVEDRPHLRPWQIRSVVTAGFGGFLVHGGAAVDQYALRAAGADERGAKVRITALDGFEHGVLSLIGEIAAIVLLVRGATAPPLDFIVPWAVLPLLGFVIAFWLAERNRRRLRQTDGWRAKIGIFLDGIHLVREMFRHPLRHGLALAGMTVFWVAEMATAWLGLAAFGYHMAVPEFIVGLGTGMVFTRRTGPFAGAGVLELVLPLTIWAAGAPFAVAVLGMFTYRVLSVWLPMPFALQCLHAVRQIGQTSEPGAEDAVPASNEPALRTS